MMKLCGLVARAGRTSNPGYERVVSATRAGTLFAFRPFTRENFDIFLEITSSFRKMVLQAIRYSRGSLEVIDQLKLPHEQIYFRVDNPEAGWNAIQSMRVRGAPAIAIVAALSLAVYLHQVDANDIPLLDASSDKYANFIIKSLKYLVTSRPTAVNLADAARKLERLVYVAQTQSGSTVPNIRKTYIEAAEKMLLDDVQDNKNIGKYGAEWIATHAGSSGSTPDMSIVTHCNTG